MVCAIVGVNVIDLGLAGTEEIYFCYIESRLRTAASSLLPLTILSITMAWNWLLETAKPISRNSGLNEIEQLTETQPWLVDKSSAARGSYQRHSNLDAYISHLLGYITPQQYQANEVGS